MARADYRLCDKCGRKAFYDATLDYDFHAYPDTGMSNLGDWTVLCRECAAQFKCVIVNMPVDAATTQPTDAVHQLEKTR